MKTTGPSRNESESTTLMDEQNQEEIKNSSTPFPVSSSIPNLLTSLWICNNLYEFKKKRKKKLEQKAAGLQLGSTLKALSL